MSNFITTNKHPELKEGLIFEYWSDSGLWVCGPSNFYKVMVNQLEALLEKGYIKEVEKPEFTKSDMIDLVRYDLSDTLWAARDVVNDWIKNKEK